MVTEPELLEDEDDDDEEVVDDEEDELEDEELELPLPPPEELDPLPEQANRQGKKHKATMSLFIINGSELYTGLLSIVLNSQKLPNSAICGLVNKQDLGKTVALF